MKKAIVVMYHDQNGHFGMMITCEYDQTQFDCYDNPKYSTRMITSDGDPGAIALCGSTPNRNSTQKW